MCRKKGGVCDKPGTAGHLGDGAGGLDAPAPSVCSECNETFYAADPSVYILVSRHREIIRNWLESKGL